MANPLHVWRTVCCSVMLLAACLAVQAAEPQVQFSDGTLTLTFGPEDNSVRLLVPVGLSNDLYIQLDDEIDLNTLGRPLLFQGQPIDIRTVSKMVIHMGAGHDKFIEPLFNVPEIWFYAGAGDDVVKLPTSAAVAHVFGGPGDDKINAEHNRENYLYGEDGNDQLGGSSDGANLLDGGSGTNLLLTYRHRVQCPCNKRSVVVHHQGANDTCTDMGAGNDYVFVSNGSGLGGSLKINEAVEDSGHDRLDFRTWPYPVQVNLSLSTEQIVSVGAQGQPLLRLTLSNLRVEEVLLPPPNEPPVILSLPSASPNPVRLP